MPPATTTIVEATYLYKGRYKLYSREDYLLLKALRHRMLLDLIDTRRFERWLSKYPLHRKGSKPKYCGTTKEQYNDICKEFDLAKKVFINHAKIGYGPVAWWIGQVNDKQFDYVGGVPITVWKDEWIVKYNSYDIKN